MVISTRIPRLVIAGTSSGVGKTTAMVALAAALRARGLKVAVFKCGPDYLDPSYHARAARTPSHNLDGWMMGHEAVLSTFVRVSRGTDIALIEGVMGLFDSASPRTDEGSTAQVAKWLKAPVLLVTDASGMARTIAAVARGFADFDPEVKLSGLICNRVGGKGHLDLLRQAAGAPPVLGGFPNEPERAFPERHLGLMAADEQILPDKLIAAWGELASEWFDLETLVAIAGSAPDLQAAATDESSARKPFECRIAIAFDDAFHFYYEDNLRRLESLGAQLVRFSPINHPRMPDADGLYIGGGYPESHAEALSANRSMLESIRRFAASGAPIYGECGGLMYLCDSIVTTGGHQYPMAGLIPGEAVMFDRLQALGYAEVETLRPSPLGPAGLHFRGHQFRYSELRLAQDRGDVELIYNLKRRRGGAIHEGYRVRNVVASYVHAHWASNPRIARELAQNCARRARIRSSLQDR